MWQFMWRKRQFYGVSVEISWVVFGSVVIAAKVVYCVIYRRCWQTKLSWSQVCSWARVTRKLCVKHKNASRVFSIGDFVLESPFCAQRLWILIFFKFIFLSFFLYFLVGILLYIFWVLIVVVFCKWCYSYFYTVLSVCSHFYTTPQALSFKPYRV